MANNTYTFTNLQTAVVHALGGTPDVNTSAGELVNGALSWLASMAPWRWKAKALSIGSTNAISFINLPADFAEIVTVKKVGDLTGNCVPVSLDQIIDARQSLPTVNVGLWYALNFSPQASLTVEPLPFLELYPTPTATTNPYLVGTYLRQIPKLTNGTDLPDIPSNWHEFLRICCRAYAVSYETQQRGADWQMFLDMLPTYERLDGRSVGYVGRIRGGLMPPPGRSLAAQTNAIG